MLCLFVAIYVKSNSLCNLFFSVLNSFDILCTCSLLTFFVLSIFSLSLSIVLFPYILFSSSPKKSGPIYPDPSSVHLHPSFILPSLSLSFPLSLFPVEGQWLEWGPWSKCSVTCNTGTQQRQRRCSASVHGWAECKGPHQESKDCINPSCSGKAHTNECLEFTLTCSQAPLCKHGTCII